MKSSHQPDDRQRIRHDAQRAYDRCASAIYAHLISLLRNEMAAQELFQETFLRYLAYLDRGKTIRYPFSFLHRTATRLAFKFMRRESQRRIRELDPSELQAPGVEWRVEAWSLLRGIWNLLNAKDKIIAKALVVDEMTASEIVEHTGFSWGAVQRRVKKIRSLARKKDVELPKWKKK